MLAVANTGWHCRDREECVLISPSLVFRPFMIIPRGCRGSHHTQALFHSLRCQKKLLLPTISCVNRSKPYSWGLRPQLLCQWQKHHLVAASASLGRVVPESRALPGEGRSFASPAQPMVQTAPYQVQERRKRGQSKNQKMWPTPEGVRMQPRDGTGT